MIRKEFQIFKDKIPFIYNAKESLELLNNNKTIIKMGDGEFDLILSNLLKEQISYTGTKYQKYSDQLTNKLYEILISNNKNIEIMIGRSTFYQDQGECKQFSKWNFEYGKYFLQKMKKLPLDKQFFNMNRKYLDMGIFIPTHAYDKNKINFNDLFNKISSIFKNKDVLIITGDTQIEKYDKNEFLLNNFAKSIEFYYTPIRDSFLVYNKCLNDLKNKNNKIMCMVSGPMGKILAYDLQINYGIQSFCFGHLFRDYKNYKNNIEAFSLEDKNFMKD